MCSPSPCAIMITRPKGRKGVGKDEEENGGGAAGSAAGAGGRKRAAVGGSDAEEREQKRPRWTTCDPRTGKPVFKSCCCGSASCLENERRLIDLQKAGKLDLSHAPNVVLRAHKNDPPEVKEAFARVRQKLMVHKGMSPADKQSHCKESVLKKALVSILHFDERDIIATGTDECGRWTGLQLRPLNGSVRERLVHIVLKQPARISAERQAKLPLAHRRYFNWDKPEGKYRNERLELEPDEWPPPLDSSRTPLGKYLKLKVEDEERQAREEEEAREEREREEEKEKKRREGIQRKKGKGKGKRKRKRGEREQDEQRRRCYEERRARERAVANAVADERKEHKKVVDAMAQAISFLVRKKEEEEEEKERGWHTEWEKEKERLVLDAELEGLRGTKARVEELEERLQVAEAENERLGTALGDVERERDEFRAALEEKEESTMAMVKRGRDNWTLGTEAVRRTRRFRRRQQLSGAGTHRALSEAAAAFELDGVKLMAKSTFQYTCVALKHGEVGFVVVVVVVLLLLLVVIAVLTATLTLTTNARQRWCAWTSCRTSRRLALRAMRTLARARRCSSRPLPFPCRRSYARSSEWSTTSRASRQRR